MLLGYLECFAGFGATSVNKLKDTGCISDRVIDVVFGVVEGVFE